MNSNNFDKIISEVLNNELCSGCGTCVGICPTQAIDLVSEKNYQPFWSNRENCINCGLCFKVCPGKGYDIRAELKNNKDKGQNFDNKNGYYEFFAHGYSNNSNIRKKGASGGVATSLLLYLLENKIVDNVLVISHDNGIPVIKATSNISDILEAQQSKYAPVPLNIILKQIIKEDKKYAIVGTPCQIAGLKLAEKHLKIISKKIVLKIGFLCGYVQTIDSITQVKRSLGISPNEMNNWKLIGWREGEYPGTFSFKNIKTNAQKNKNLYQWLDFCVPFYSLKRCHLCIDGNNELADIVLGDVHDAGDDENVIICRTQTGAAILRQAQQQKAITYYKISKSQAEKGVIGYIAKVKKVRTSLIIEYLKKKGHRTPEFGITYQSSGKEKMVQLFLYRLSFFFRKDKIKKILEKHPFLMEKVGHFIYRFPNSVFIIKLINHIKWRFRK